MLPLGTTAVLSALYPYSNYTIDVSLTNAVGLTSISSNIIVATLSLSELQLLQAFGSPLVFLPTIRANVSSHHQNRVSHSHPTDGHMDGEWIRLKYRKLEALLHAFIFCNFASANYFLKEQETRGSVLKRLSIRYIAEQGD